MEKFVRISARAAPLLRSNVDTDAISPGDRLMRVKKIGFADALFANWRMQRLDSGISRKNPDFILNQKPYDEAKILLSGPNFGCGSSRENAVWALRDWGFKTVIAPSFGAIFIANCFKNGLLAVTLPFDEIQEIANQVFESKGNGKVTVDLKQRLIEAPDGSRYHFVISDYQRQVLLDGLDPISAALLYRKEIDDFQRGDAAHRPWVYQFPSVTEVQP